MHKPIRFLLLDDDQGQYLILKEMVADIPHRPISLDWCADYQTAREAIRKDQYKGYLVDYRFGIHNGLELIREAVQQGCRAPLILLTSYGDPEIEEQAMRAGAFDYLVKTTLSAHQLQRSIRHSLEQARNLARIRQINNELEKRVEERTRDFKQAFQALQQTNEQLQLEIQERKAAKGQVTTNQQLLQAIGGNFSNGFLVVFDSGLRIVYANGQELDDRGIHSADWLGKEASVFISADQYQHFTERLSKVFAGESAQLEYAGRTNQYYSIRAFPLPNTQEAITQILLMITNITVQREAERALQESESRFRAIFNSTYQLIGLMTPDGTLIEANEPALAFGGLTPGEVLQKKIWDTYWFRISPKTQTQLQESVAHSAQGAFIRYEMEVQGQGMTRAIVDFSIKPIRNEAGEVVLLLAEACDITEMKKAEGLLRQSEEQLKLFISQSPTAIALFDRQLHYLAASQQWLGYYGLHPTTYLGKSHYELLPDIAEMRRSFHEQCLAGQVEKTEEEYVVRADGTAVWMKWEARPWYNLEGQIQGMLLFTEDITLRKQAEQQLRESEAKFHTMFELSPVGMALSDLETGTFVDFNTTLLESTGYTAKELLAITFQQLTPTEYALADQQQVGMLRQRGRFGPYEKEHIRKDGKRFAVLLNGILVKDHQGRELSWSFIQDISEIKAREEEVNALNEELVALNLQKDKLFSVIAHDLRGPIGNVGALLELILNNPVESLSEQQVALLRLAKHCSTEVKALLEDLLLWTRNQFQKVEFEPREVSLQEIVAQIVPLLQAQLEAKQLSLHIDIPPALRIIADEHMLQVILRNLLSNAIKFSNPGGKVFIQVSHQGKEVEIAVKDEGVGISAPNLAKLFSKTASFTTPGTQGEKGSGLGLELCQDFAEKHGGCIRVISKENQGSTFTFSLPVSLSGDRRESC